jgi:hypothetical protein
MTGKNDSQPKQTAKVLGRWRWVYIVGIIVVGAVALCLDVHFTHSKAPPIVVLLGAVNRSAMLSSPRATHVPQSESERAEYRRELEELEDRIIEERFAAEERLRRILKAEDRDLRSHSGVGVLHSGFLTARDTVDVILERLRDGNLAYSAPKQMSLGERTTVQLALTLEMRPEDLKRLMAARGEKLSAPVKMNSRMEAHLLGSGFEITAIDAELQAISMNEVTRWAWEVKSKEPGQQALHLTVSVVLDVDGQQRPRCLETFSTNIDVKVPWKEQVASFAGQNWKWLWTMLLVPLAGWGWRKHRKRK